MQLYLIGGKARSGKDTIGKLLTEAYLPSLKKCAILHITEPLEELSKNYFGWDGKEETKPRELLQKLGIEIIRDKMQEKDLLKRHLVDKIEILSSFFEVIVVTDLRLIEEFTYLKNRYPHAITIHVLREDFDNHLSQEEKTHLTETDLERAYQFDYMIENTSIKKMREQIEKIVEKEERRCIE